MAAMIQSLVRRAEDEDRLIVSWSSRERIVVENSPELSSEVKDRFVVRWRDAKWLARRWKNKKHRDVVFPRIAGRGRHRLDCYMRLIGYKIPSSYGDQQAAQRIAYARAQLRKKGSADAMTPVAKAKWTKVLNYNFHDCNGMREVTIRAVNEL
jgi:hypothetical protein